MFNVHEICSLYYTIEFDKEYTLKEFIDILLKDKNNLFGNIEL